MASGGLSSTSKTNQNTNNTNVNNSNGTGATSNQNTNNNITFSQPTIDKVNKAKVMLENYYNNLLQECDEREERYRKLEETMKAQGLNEQEKNERRTQHALKETEFLRLKRLKLSYNDFTPIKVIGKGAFGEVRLVQKKRHWSYLCHENTAQKGHVTQRASGTCES